MILLSSKSVGQWDYFTIKQQGLESWQLMERAAGACCDWLLQHYDYGQQFVVLCGSGNNGGDGLAISRILGLMRFPVTTYLINYTGKLSPDCQRNLDLLKKVEGTKVIATMEAEDIAIPTDAVVIDAVMGNGTNRPASGKLAKILTEINQLPNQKVAIDIPSGLASDTYFGADAVPINSNHTLSFQQYKRSMLHPETGDAFGEIHVLDIGLADDFESAENENHNLTTLADAKQLYKPRKQFSHKGTFGTAMLVGGSYGMVGAIALATRAAGRAGAGKVIAHAPACGYQILQQLCPEAMFKKGGVEAITSIPDFENVTALGIGPGMGDDAETVNMLHQLLQNCKKPMVLDADSLNILAKHKDWLHYLPADTIITPHPKEFARLFGKTENSYDRVALAMKKAQEYNIIIVAKDRYTAIALPNGEVHYNSSGNAALATGGTGDVLCGIITGLLASGYNARDASIMGCYLHGLAGERASEIHGLEATLAWDVAEAISFNFS